MPLEATQHTSDGAKAFVRFFVMTIDWGYATTSGAYVKHFSASGCQGCKDFLTGFARARRAGHHYIGGRISVNDVRLAPKAIDAGAQYTAIADFAIQSIEEVDAKNKFVNADGSHSHEKLSISVAWRGSRWTVVELGVHQ